MTKCTNNNDGEYQFTCTLLVLGTTKVRDRHTNNLYRKQNTPDS